MKAECRLSTVVEDLAGGAEVRANSHSFKNAGDSEELGDRGHGEGVGALLGCATAESGGQEGDVGFLVVCDLEQARVGVGRQAGGGEVARGEFGQAFAVEGCFELFEGEGVVEDLDWIRLLGIALGRWWRDLLSEKSIKLCLLTRLIGWGRAHDEATRPRTAAYFAKDMLAICFVRPKAAVTGCASAWLDCA
jgi:hypothetical protein